MTTRISMARWQHIALVSLLCTAGLGLAITGLVSASGAGGILGLVLPFVTGGVLEWQLNRTRQDTPGQTQTGEAPRAGADGRQDATPTAPYRHGDRPKATPRPRSAPGWAPAFDSVPPGA